MIGIVALFIVVVGLVVHNPGVLQFDSEAARRKHLTRYRNYRSAINVWKQMPHEDRRAVLIELGYSDEEANRAIERDDLSGIKATGAKRDRVINEVRFYPRSQRQRTKFKVELVAHPRLPDVRVRAHEKRLREKGLRRPEAIRRRSPCGGNDQPTPSRRATRLVAN